MVEQFLPNLKQAPEGMFFAETDLDQLVDLSHQARMVADIGTDVHALGLVDKDKPSRKRRRRSRAWVNLECSVCMPSFFHALKMVPN
jgi:hypothetical protein